MCVIAHYVSEVSHFSTVRGIIHSDHNPRSQCDGDGKQAIVIDRCIDGKRYEARDLLSDRDLHLFVIACRPYHCLYHLLPPERHVGYELRDRGHSHELIAHKYKMTRSSFIVRTLFDNM